MTAIVINASELTTAQLVRVYNQLSERAVTKFSDRKTAIRRVEQQLSDRGYEVISDSEQDEIIVRVASTEVDETEDTTETTDAPSAPSTTAAAAAAKSPRTSPSVRRGPTSAFLGMEVVVLVSNPKRKGSRAFELFSLYSFSSSVDEYLDLAEKQEYQRRDALANLNWDVRHGFVKVELPEQSR